MGLFLFFVFFLDVSCMWLNTANGFCPTLGDELWTDEAFVSIHVSRVLSSPFVHLAPDHFTIKELSPCCNLSVCLGRFSELSGEFINPNQEQNQCCCSAEGRRRPLRHPGLETHVYLRICFCDTYGGPPCTRCSQRAETVAASIPRSAGKRSSKKQTAKTSNSWPGKECSQESRTLFLFRFRVGSHRTLPGPLIPHCSLAQLWQRQEHLQKHPWSRCPGERRAEKCFHFTGLNVEPLSGPETCQQGVSVRRNIGVAGERRWVLLPPD